MLKISGYFILLLLVFIVPGQSQIFEKQIGEQQWHLLKTLNNTVEGQSEETFALYQVSKESFGILMINSKGQIKWKTAIQEKPFYLSKLEGKLIVLSGEETGFSVGANNINASLIDPETGKNLLQKTILTGNKSNVIIPTIYLSETGKVLKIGLRYANKERGAKMALFGTGNGKLNEFASQITKAEILTFNKNIELINTQSLQFPSTTVLDGGSCMDAEGNIIYAAYNKENNEVLVYRFPDGKALSDKQMKINIAVKKLELIKDMQLIACKRQTSGAYFVANYRNEDKGYVFEIHNLDFNTGVKTMASDIINKDYRKHLESESFKLYKGVRNPDLDDIEDLKLTSLTEIEGKLIVCKDAQHSETSMSNSPVFVAGNGLISVYSNDMKKMYEHVIPKKYRSYLPFGLGIGMHAKDGYAYFVANDSESGYMKAGVLFGKMDISSGNIVSIEHLVKDDIGAAEPADTKNVIWFKDKTIISYMKLKGMFSWAYTNIPSIYSY